MKTKAVQHLDGFEGLGIVSHNPLAEVFGFHLNDTSERASRCRDKKLCPFNNKVPNCTKDKAKDPLGVCSVYANGEAVITCPIRFREEWIITVDAAEFFFSEGTKWTSLTEVRLLDGDERSAGNIDIVLVSYDEQGRVIDFGSLEIQAVYISGNVRDPFNAYMELKDKSQPFSWKGMPNYPRPDFLSSSRKRLAPQLLYKGGILSAWNKKMAVALDGPFYRTLPELRECPVADADMAWLVYDLVPEDKGGKLGLKRVKTLYTKFSSALDDISRPKVGPVEDFIAALQLKIDKEIQTAPTNQTIERPF